MEIGSIVKAMVEGLQGWDTPVVRLPDGSRAFIVENQDNMCRYRSNRQKDLLVLDIETRGIRDQEAEVKITGRMNGHFFAVLYTPTASGMTSRDAHEVLLSDSVSYARCLNDKFAVAGFDRMGREKIGFINENRRWLDSMQYAESVIGLHVLYGRSKKFPGVKQDDCLLVREIGNNAAKNKEKVTYFFEPVITIRESDDAVDMYSLEKMVTRMVDGWGEEPGCSARGGYLFDIPIHRTSQDSRDAGIGYVPRPQYELRRNRHLSGLKEVIIEGAAHLLGKIARKADIIYDKEMVRAELSRVYD